MNERDLELPEGYRMTELGPLPEEWEVVRLGDVVKTIKGRKPQQLTEDPKGESVPYLTAQYFRTRDASKFVPKDVNNFVKVNKDDIVFIWDGSNAGDVFTGLEGALASTMIRIDPQGDTNKKFLYYYIKTKFLLFNTKTTGSTIPHVNKNLFYNLAVPIPPLPEQKKIAAVLSTIQEAKERTEAVISATRDLKNSMMKYLFTYGPVPLPEAENVPLKETEIGMIPEEWEVVRLGDVAEFNLGRTPKRVNESYWDDGKYPWVSIADMSDFGYIYDTKEKVSQKAYEEVFKKRLVPKETLLMSFKLTIGRTSILKTDAFHNEAIISIRPNNNQVLKEFLFYFLPTIDFSNYYDNVVKGKTLNSAKIKKLLISLPPLSTQQKIASMLSAIDEKIEAEENKKKALDDLFNTLLHDLMTAKIRVNHLDLDEIELSV